MIPALMSPSGYPLPALEDERLAEIAAFEVGRGPREGLEQICQLAASLFDAPMALVTLIHADHQEFVAALGVEGAGTARADAFCAWTVCSDEPTIVPDASLDARFAQHAAVTGAPYVRFYAGAPLLVRKGVALGSLCIVDTKPRAFGDKDAEHLRRLAALVVNEFRRRRSLSDLGRREALLTQTARMSRVGSWEYEVDADRMRWSEEALEITGLSPRAVGSRDATLACFAAGESRAWAAEGFRDLITRGAPMDGEAAILTPQGEERWVRCIAEAERRNGRTVRVVGSFQDVTERRQAEAQVERLAFRDALTGLPNRALFQRKFQQAVEAASAKGGKVGLIMLDLDHFKDVNESLGHEAGDALLCSVAERLASAYRKSDTVARLGGDEFAVILPSVNGPDDLIRPTEKVMDLLRRPLQHEGRTLSITASVGAAVYDRQRDDAAQLLKNADIALYEAKGAGRNRIVTFEPTMRSAVEERIELLRQVREGVARGEFALYYQPIVHLADGGRRVAGFEGLMRWVHPERGVLAPAAFMAAFDDQELALQLGEAALDGAMKQMRQWMAEGVRFGRVAVNVSPAQFRTGRLAETVADKLVRWELPAEVLAIEVTENVYMGWGSEVVGDALNALHAAGVEIALDDFGTGYASLAHLKQFPIDRLKIDKSFVQSEDDSAIVKAVITLGSSLGMKLVAEGVETPAQLAFLRECGCDQAQGYLFSRPMPAEDVPAFLAERAPGRAKLRLA